MQSIIFSVLLLLALCAGCRTRYDITLSNSDVIQAHSRPKLDDRGCYVFKDASGKEVRVPASRIRQIEAK